MLEQKEIKDAIKDAEKTKIKLVRKKVKGFMDGLYVESILVDSRPYFLCVSPSNHILSTKEMIAVDEVTFKPLDAEQCGYFPYSFRGSELAHLNYPISKDEIFDDIKNEIDRYVSLRELDKHLILGDILLTYCQEQISTVHYPFFVGETESGKSTILHLARWLCYRCHLGDDIPNADIYNFLGTDEEGAGTIAEDEAQDLWKNKSKLSTYKTSYAKGSTKARILGVDTLGKHQVYYKTFCPKWFAGEMIPQNKGFVERLAIVHMTEGKPQSNIKRPTKDELDRLNGLRNRLLVWKLQNMNNGLTEINSDLEQRDQELWEDFLRVGYGTKYFERFRNVVIYHIEQRHAAIKNSFEATIFKLITDKLNNRLELDALKFWEYIINDNPELPGRIDEKNGTFYPDDFSKVTKNSLAKILSDKFQAIKRTRYEELAGKYSKVTFYTFKLEIMQALAKKYDVSLPINSSLYSGLGGQSSQSEITLNHLEDLDHLNKGTEGVPK
jgi:hypothetical protein